MIFQMGLLNLNIVLLSMSALYECKKIHAIYSEEFINLAVISDYVYIGCKNSLVQFNSSLDIVNIKPTKGRNWLLTPYTTTDEGTILIACEYIEEYDSLCTGYRNNLSIIDEYEGNHIPIKKPQARYTTTNIASKNILTIASSDCVRSATSSEDCFAISNYDGKILILNNNRKYTVEYLIVNGEKPQIKLDFRTVVENGKYTYYLFILNHTISKLGKTCNDIITKPLLNAYEDVPIFCSHNGVNFTTAHDLMFWNDDLLVVFTDGTASVICKFTKLFISFEISRIERLKCQDRQLGNKYFHNPSFNLCYNETLKKCQSSTNVSIILILLFECRHTYCWNVNGLFHKL